VDVTLEEWPSMIHVWHWFLSMLDEAERAIEGIGRFVRRVHGPA
jgi:acetyl esterase/lipase